MCPSQVRCRSKRWAAAQWSLDTSGRLRVETSVRLPLRGQLRLGLAARSRGGLPDSRLTAAAGKATASTNGAMIAPAKAADGRRTARPETGRMPAADPITRRPAAALAALAAAATAAAIAIAIASMTTIAGDRMGAAETSPRPAIAIVDVAAAAAADDDDADMPPCDWRLRLCVLPGPRHCPAPPAHDQGGGGNSAASWSSSIAAPSACQAVR
jgi:hypothetical protein